MEIRKVNDMEKNVSVIVKTIFRYSFTSNTEDTNTTTDSTQATELVLPRPNIFP